MDKYYPARGVNIPCLNTLMALESKILVGILLELASKGVAALPMHDGIMVAASNKQLAIETMRKVSEEKVGRPLQVVEKAI
ncbi:hypothetical protein [Rhizobium leguminosarum]|uniref:hypothetical protein n=1 Tax=Rhizobium leguminosarum TaxID=384 RepID=UPI001FE21615|nr:hypothetical protein [Rhizobium leguminosarum]